jgi:transcriptional regulator with XRE-family HTH domain
MSNNFGPAVVAYPAIVGKTIAALREARGIKQGDFATSLGLSPSAYSRLEAGESALSVIQLRNVALLLGMTTSELISQADQHEAALRQKGVDVVSEKKESSAAVAIGLGILAAVILASR